MTKLPAHLRASVDLSQRPAEEREVVLAMHRLGVQGWMEAYLRAESLLSREVRQLTSSGYGHEAVIMQLVTNLQDEALHAVIKAPVSARPVIEKAVRKLSLRLREQYVKDVRAMVEEAMTPVREQMRTDLVAELREPHEAEIRAVREQFDLLEHAATTAQAEASAAEKRLREAEEELKKAQYRLRKAEEKLAGVPLLSDVQAELETERRSHQALRDSVVLRERESQQREGTLTHQISSLTHENHALRAEVEALRQAPPPALPTESLFTFASPLDALSFRAFLIEQGVVGEVQARQVTTAQPVSLTLLSDWASAYPDAASRRRQIKAKLPPLTGNAAD